MKVLLDIKDNKAAMVMEILNNLPFVKSTVLSKKKSKLLSEIKEAIEEVNLVKSGKIKSKDVQTFLDEL